MAYRKRAGYDLFSLVSPRIVFYCFRLWENAKSKQKCFKTTYFHLLMSFTAIKTCSCKIRHFALRATFVQISLNSPGTALMV